MAFEVLCVAVPGRRIGADCVLGVLGASDSLGQPPGAAEAQEAETA
jgi:hypothetical protein